MRKLLILGAGTAGTILANRLRKELAEAEWQITVVDRDDSHHYQPGYLFIPFGIYSPRQIVKPRWRFLPDGVDFTLAEVERIDADGKSVLLKGGRTLDYDYLIVTTGAVPRPDQTPGMADGELWHTKVFDFYTLEGSAALHQALERFTGGRLVVHITEMPIKCPVAPLEFSFLADDYLTRRGIRDKVSITYVTPLDGAFTKPVASATLGHLLTERGIEVETDFMIESIDNEAQAIVSYDEREIPFDLLVTVPLNMGQQFIIDSGLGDELGFIPVDKHTLRSVAHDDIFVLGDASNVPTSKAGSVAHFEADVFVDNFVALAKGEPMTHSFDGHANCFVESGRGKGLLLDFNYETQPLTGTFPLPRVGPMQLLKESRSNHLGKLAFEHIYWHMLLPGRPIPLPAAMSMTGKIPADPSMAAAGH
ncbi:MAG: NAD(P)/FAD-dependent oxidoreductase [Micrococcales bacterium]|nr:NAD(P)/FAD-dependent oxidoreductase [Micrococcales bacterium]